MNSPALREAGVKQALRRNFILSFLLYASFHLVLLAVTLGNVWFAEVFRLSFPYIIGIVFAVCAGYLVLLSAVFKKSGPDLRPGSLPFWGTLLFIGGAMVLSLVIIGFGMLTRTIVLFSQSAYLLLVASLFSIGLGFLHFLYAKKLAKTIGKAEKPPSLTLFQRMFIPILIILSFLFAILAVGLYYQNSRKVYALYSREIAAKVEVRSQYLASLFEGIKGQMDVLANTKEVMEGDLENILLLLQRMHTVKGDYINDYFFSALDGVTLTSSNPARVNIQDRPYFREAVSSGVIAFSDPVVSRLDGRVIIIVANPVKKDGKTIGVVSATVEVKSLDQVFNRNILTETGRYILLSREGVVVYHPRKEYVGQRVGKDIVDDGKDTVGIEKVLTEPPRRFFSYILEGRRSTSYKVEIPLTGYILLFSLDSSDFITPLNSVILQLIIFFLSLIAILCAVLALVARSFSREITDRKAAEEVLRESEEKYRSLFQNMTSGFAFHEVIVDEKNTPVDYRYIDVNQAFERLTSIPVSRVLGRRVREAVPEMSDEWIRRYGEVALSGIPFAYEYYTTLTSRHFESYVYSPKRGYFAVVFNDVTERKRAEDRLKELNAHLEDLVKERTSQLSAANGELKASNEQLDQALRRLRDTQSQLILSEKMAGLGQLAAGIAHEINTPLGAILSSVRTILLCSERDIPGVLDGYASFDQETKTLFTEIYSLCASIFDPHSFDDLIEERARKKELVALLEEKGIPDPPEAIRLVFELGAMRHIEALLPLLRRENRSVISALLQRLLSLSRSSRIIQTAAEKASSVILALRTYSHHERLGAKVRTNIKDEMETLLTLYYNKTKHGVRIIKRYCEDASIACYPEELNQVWVNLLNNALQAMNYLGVLEIEMRRDDRGLWVSISDNGPEIPADIRGRIFEPFFTTKQQGEGTGLGLDIAMRIVERHGGEISFETGPEKTVFTVFLPDGRAV